MGKLFFLDCYVNVSCLASLFLNNTDNRENLFDEAMFDFDFENNEYFHFSILKVKADLYDYINLNVMCMVTWHIFYDSLTHFSDYKVKRPEVKAASLALTMSSGPNMLKLIWGKGQGPSAERVKVQKQLFGFSREVNHGFPNKPTCLAWDPQLKLIGKRPG